MTGDRTATDPAAGKAQPAGAGNAGPSMDALSRQLGERVARQRTVDPDAAAAARRAALQAYDQARERRLIAGLSVALALTVGAALAYFVSTLDTQPVPPLARAAALPEPAAAPPDVALASSSPTPTATPTATVEPAPTEAPPPADSPPADVKATPSAAPLQRDEVREIQAKLRSFGFNPGPVDGNPGRMTDRAVRRYQQDRGQPQTGEIDRALLDQLRQDPAPPVARQVDPRAAPPTARAARSAGPRRADLFEPVRAAGNRFGQWLDSLVR
jgi:Putative peptidoglycan binding domain